MEVDGREPEELGSLKRIWQAGILLFVGTACSDASPGVDAPPSVDAPRCDVSSTASSWAVAARDHELVVEYGVASGQELVDVWGLTATSDGTVLVWDAGSTRIVRLDSDLEFLGTSGGQGRGPGEFVYQQSVHGKWIATNDSTFLVIGFSTGILSEFALDGSFLRYPTLAPPFPIPIRGVEYFRGHLVYGVDVIDRDGGTRSLETWRLESRQPHTLLRTDPMPTLPESRGRPVQDQFQADPLWALGDRCIYVSDGSGPWVLRADLVTGGSDTMVLPDLPVPSETDLELWHDMLMDARSFGVAPKGIETVGATAPVRWADLRVDPEGFLWIERWRPPSYRGDSVTALVIDPHSGLLDSVRLRRFPDAFLPGGEVVSVVEEVDGLRLEKYGGKKR